MRRSPAACAVLAAAATIAPLAAQLPAETPAQRDARMQWWREARFGMFVHWGLYSGLAGTWQGKVVGTKGGMEWIENYVKADTDTYAAAAIPLFRPQPEFADAWAALAKAAGCRYLVFTTKHHDGFALHDSKVSDYDAGSVLHRDLVAEITTAARKAGLKVGFYHSVIDWHHDQYEYARSKQLPHPLRDVPYPDGARDHTKYLAYLFGEVKELCAYRPDVFWWDYSALDFQGDEAWHAGELLRSVRSTLPEVIVNNRLYRSREAGWVSMGTDGYSPTLDPRFGDFITPEQHIPPTGMPGVDWETCMTMNTTWGYSDHDHAWKPAKELLHDLIDIASKGGNFLLNIGPRADGSVPAESIAALQTIGGWMDVHGDAIHGTTASPFAALTFGRCTKKSLPGGGTRLFLHVFQAPADGCLWLPALPNDVRACVRMEDPAPLDVTATTGPDGAPALRIQLPPKLAIDLPIVVRLDVDGEVAAPVAR